MPFDDDSSVIHVMNGTLLSPYISCLYRLEVSVLVLVSATLIVFTRYHVDTKICSVAQHWWSSTVNPCEEEKSASVHPACIAFSELELNVLVI